MTLDGGFALLLLLGMAIAESSPHPFKDLIVEPETSKQL